MKWVLTLNRTRNTYNRRKVANITNKTAKNIKTDE